MRLNIDGIELELTKKRIRNVYIYVKPPDGGVYVSMPARMSMAEVERFVRSKHDWIIKNCERLRSREKREDDIGVGSNLYIWGRPYIIKEEESTGKSNFEISGIFVILRYKDKSTKQDREKLIKNMYASLLKDRLAQRVPVWEEKTGLKCSAWGVRYMTSRWGSCNTRTKKLNFNTRLAEKDPVYLEYVILHELAHTKVANHGEKFKAILDQYMIDWKKIRKSMR